MIFNGRNLYEFEFELNLIPKSCFLSISINYPNIKMSFKLIFFRSDEGDFCIPGSWVWASNVHLNPTLLQPCPNRPAGQSQCTHPTFQGPVGLQTSKPIWMWVMLTYKDITEISDLQLACGGDLSMFFQKQCRERESVCGSLQG